MILNNFVVCFVVTVLTVEILGQNPEINDQFSETHTNETEITDVPGGQTDKPANYNRNDNTTTVQVKTQNTILNNTRKSALDEVQEPIMIIKLYKVIENSITTFFASRKVIYVLHNIGTCVVNGVMEIITFYLPAPMIPFIASAAGMLVPFEPVITLKEKMPVTSYRRAFNRAVDSFMGTFDKFKTIDDDIEDPYMTQRFNRRFMNDGRSKEKKRNVL